MVSVASAIALCVGIGLAAPPSTEGVWSLEFTYKTPRRIVINVPGEDGDTQKVVWYMVYQVVNRSGQPRTFQPKISMEYERGKAVEEAVVPGIEKMVMETEGLTEAPKNLVTWAAKPVPLSPSKGTATPTHGIACWENVDPKLEQMTIYVAGLSNDMVRVSDPASKMESVREKTLKIQFKNAGSATTQRIASDPKWLYR